MMTQLSTVAALEMLKRNTAKKLGISQIGHSTAWSASTTPLLVNLSSQVQKRFLEDDGRTIWAPQQSDLTFKTMNGYDVPLGSVQP